ncbi:hypothetical protein E2C01_032217 [Portunus trituberculatus]|uniref:Uncharacterized protein n=1 Tax=Portunus trituberculatus TaxID=210409 RepID=A0A5B7EZ36_PORTR|nr:hypothetical protein [Portunus trituberculatus]
MGRPSYRKGRPGLELPGYSTHTTLVVYASSISLRKFGSV